MAEHQYNTTTFDEVTTTQLRLEIDSDGTFSTGILEWKVLDSGKSPDFPPIVAAGVDRVVIQGGTTYLNGRVQSLIARWGQGTLGVEQSLGTRRGFLCGRQGHQIRRPLFRKPESTYWP